MVSHLRPVQSGHVQLEYVRAARWSQQVWQLQSQLQKRLSTVRVISYSASSNDQLDSQLAYHRILAETHPTIAVLPGTAASQVTVPKGHHRDVSGKQARWALSLIDRHHPIQWLVQQMAQQKISEYWTINTQQVEVTVYQSPMETVYQNQQIFHVGDHISPSCFPSITLEIQEPLSLSFFTRTASGLKTYAQPRLPVRLLSSPLDTSC